MSQVAHDAVARLRLTGNGSGGVAAGSTQEIAFQLTDAQFSVIAVATPGKPGVVIDRIAYSAYGEATRTLRSDVNGDGFVNKDDYNGVIRSRLNTTIGSSGYVVEADLDRDGKVAQSDYDIAVADDGKSSSGGVGEAGLFSRGVRNGVGYCGYIFNNEISAALWGWRASIGTRASIGLSLKFSVDVCAGTASVALGWSGEVDIQGGAGFVAPLGVGTTVEGSLLPDGKSVQPTFRPLLERELVF